MAETVGPVLLKAVRTQLSGAVRTAPGAVPTPPVIQLLNVQKGINRTQITCSLLAQYLNFVMYKTNTENEKNNVTSRYAGTYTTINCKTQHRIASFVLILH